ncbi:MAG: LysE family transporter [Actinomycetota bacterium]
MSTSILFLGFAIGLISIIPPGPVSLALIEVGATHGRRHGARGGIGVAVGEVVTAALAATVVVVGAGLPASVFAALQVVSSMLILAMGAVLIGRPGAVHAAAVEVRRPGRTLFLITVFTPTVFGAWVAILGALPFAGHATSLAVFVVGGAVASFGWHLLLGSAAGDLGTRLSADALTTATRIGGVGLVAFGLFTLVRQL